MNTIDAPSLANVPLADIKTAHVVNFGEGNFLWPECLRRSAVATYESQEAYDAYRVGDKARYIALCKTHITTSKGGVPTTAMASGWYNWLNIVTQSSAEIWVHIDGERLWWTVTSGKPAEVESLPGTPAASPYGEAIGVFKPAATWSCEDQTGRYLSWLDIHPRAKNFLRVWSTRRTLSGDSLRYLVSLLAGADLDEWHMRDDWREARFQDDKTTVTRKMRINATVKRMAATALATTLGARGQQELRIVKRKDFLFESLEHLGEYLYVKLHEQKGLCAISGLELHYDGLHTDSQMLCSLDRIDSSLHYAPGNVQIVCRFINRWKSDEEPSEFRRLLHLVCRSASPR